LQPLQLTLALEQDHVGLDLTALHARLEVGNTTTGHGGGHAFLDLVILARRGIGASSDSAIIAGRFR